MKQTPELRYRFDFRGAEVMKLAKAAHWEGLKEDLISKQKKRKDGTVIGVNIEVSEEVSA